MKKVEDELWDAHGRINKRFRSQLARFRGQDGRRKHVERRKLEKHYLDFIKSSMRFYRGFIQSLASHFTDVPEVLKVALLFNLDSKWGLKNLYLVSNRYSFIRQRAGQSKCAFEEFDHPFLPLDFNPSR